MSEADIDGLVVREVDAGRWGDLERLFESRGGPSHCWCMVWRRTAGEPTVADRPGRKAAMRRRVQEGVPVGILGYLGEEPVAWCSIAPKSTYRRLGGTSDPADDPDSVWSLACFFVTRRMRGQGLMARLIREATEHARARGARVVEAYPVERDSPSYRFMGFVPAFEAAGFQEVGRAGSRRHIMRLRVA